MTIVIGKYYRRVDGEVVGPAKPISSLFSDMRQTFEFVVGGGTYKQNGKYQINEQLHHLDLVNEVSVVDIPQP